MPVPRLGKPDFVEIYRRVLPGDYVAPLEEQDDGLGMDLAHAFGAMMELADCATNKGTQSCFVRPHSSQTDVPAQEQTKAVGTIALVRSGNVLGRILVPAHTAIEAYSLDSYGEEIFLGRYFTKWQVWVEEGSGSTVQVDIEAELPGYFGNLPVGVASFRFVSLGRLAIPAHVDSFAADKLVGTGTGADDTFSPYLLGRYVTVEPAFGVVFSSATQYPRRIFSATYSQATVVPTLTGDLGKSCVVNVLEFGDVIALTQVSSIAGGNGGMLDARAVSLGLTRGPNEPDAVLSGHVEAVADTTTPAAVMRAVDAILGPLGVAWRLVETGDPEGLGGFVWDLHPWDFGSFASVTSDSEVYSVQGALLLSRSQTRRFFVVAVSTAIDAFPGVAAQVWKRVNDIRGFGVSFRLVMEPAL